MAKKHILNNTVLMSGAEYFEVQELNPYSISSIQPNKIIANDEHNFIKSTLEKLGVNVVKVPAPKNCQDGIYTANWGLCRNDKVILSNLPNQRKNEESYAEETLKSLGKKVIKSPYKFSGQGDALPCGNLLFCGSTYRTDIRMHDFIEKELGYEVIGLQTIPVFDNKGKPLINKITGWPDSFFYDIDLAIAVIRKDLIAYCPDAFTVKSQEILKNLEIKKIEVTMQEAQNGFACNLISTGETVIMSANAPLLKSEIENYGIQVVTPKISELSKGGGYIRCTTLTLDND